MEKFIGVIQFQRPEELIAKVVSVSLKKEPENFWFKVTGSGIDEDGSLYIFGFDLERMNRKIYVRDIENIVI